MRAPRDLLRRRFHLPRQRAELRAHGQQTNRQYTLPESGPQRAYKAKRDGVAERCPAPAVPQRGAVDLTLLDYYDRRLRDVEWTIGQTAKAHQAQALYRRQAVPGIGKMVRLGLRDAIHDIYRFPSVQDGVAYCRLVTCAQEAAGKRSGTGGAKSGNTHLQWAVAEAAVLLLRNPPAAQK